MLRGRPILDPNGNMTAATSFADAADNFCRTSPEDVSGKPFSAAEAISRKKFFPCTKGWYTGHCQHLRHLMCHGATKASYL